MKKTTNATFGIDKDELVQVAPLQIHGGDGAYFVSASRKSDRSFIGAFLPDLFRVIYQFSDLSNSSDDGQQEWFACAHLSISMYFAFGENVGWLHCLLRDVHKRNGQFLDSNKEGTLGIALLEMFRIARTTLHCPFHESSL